MNINLTRKILQHRTFSIVSMLLLIVFGSYGIRFLSLTVDYREYFSATDPQLAAYNRIQADYSNNDNILIAIRARQGDLFNRPLLALIEALTTAGWSLPYSHRVDSITNFQYSRAEGDELVVEPLFAHLDRMNEATIAQRRQVALQEPRLRGLLLATDAQATAVNISFTLPHQDDLAETAAAVGATRALVERFARQHPDVEFHLGGQLITNQAFPEATSQDTTRLFPLVLLVMTLMIALAIPHLWSVLLVVLLMLFSVTVALGTVGWFGVRLTPDSIAGSAMIMPIAIANAVHLLLAYFHRLQKGVQPLEAMAQSITANFMPMFLTAFTTVVGFLAVNFSDSPPYRLMSNIVAIGQTVTFILTFLLLAPVATFMQRRVEIRSVQDRLDPLMCWLSRCTTRHQKALLLFMGISTVLAIPLTMANRVSDNPLDWFSEQVPFRQDVDWINRHLSGVTFIDYPLAAGGDMGITEPAFLQKLDAFTHWLRSQPRVRHVASISDTFKQLNQEMNQGETAHYRIPESRELASQYLLLYEMSLPFGLDLTNQLNFDKSSTRVSVALDKLSTVETIAFDQQVQQWMQANLPPQMRSQGSGLSVMLAHMTDRNTRYMLYGAVVAKLLMALTLLLAFRSWKISLVGLVPNMVPAFYAFAIWWFCVAEVGLALSMVLSMTFGIIVDNTIHLIDKYDQARRTQGHAHAEATLYSYREAGPGVVVSSLSLCCGFAVLMVSDFTQNAQLGLMTTLIMLLALGTNLLFLPPLLACFTPARWRHLQSAQPASGMQGQESDSPSGA
ncbi:MAG: MMPL family transporter [Pseudomonadales bacterium]|nr:MMPL family transporter [Pseudomonadales bacterium]